MNPILRTVLQRLGLGVLTLFVVSIIIFTAIAMLPEAGYVVTTGGDGMVRLWPWKR